MNRTIKVRTKTGFKITDPTVPVNIRDDRGILFYSTESRVPEITEFNLPPGTYLVDSGHFREMLRPINFKLERLPVSENLLSRAPYHFEIIFEDNPNKCTIFWKEKLIVFDTKFQDAPLPELFFIYFHELGHSRYGYETRYSPEEAEAYCDLYASNEMLKMGFNPSQVDAAPKNTLSSRQDYRKNFIEETLLDNSTK